MFNWQSVNNDGRSKSKIVSVVVLLVGIVIVASILLFVASLVRSKKVATIDLGCGRKWDVVSYDEEVIKIASSKYDEVTKCQTYTIESVSDNATVITFSSGVQGDKETRFFYVSVEDVGIEVNEKDGGSSENRSHRYDEYIDMGTYDGEEHEGLHDGY